MLRVGGGQPPPEMMPPEPPMPPEAMPPEAMPPETEIPSLETSKVDPMIAGYKTPDLGPFICGNCLHFDGTDTCQVVAGPIDPEGVCNIWTPPSTEGAPDEEAMVPEGEEVEPEMAPEEPPVG